MQCLVFAQIFWGLVLVKGFSRAFHMAAGQRQSQLFGLPEAFQEPYPLAITGFLVECSLDVFGPTSAACGFHLLVLVSLVSCCGEQGIWPNAHVLLADTMALRRHLLKAK